MWLLVDRTNTETIAQEPKHAPTYTAQRRLTWQEQTEVCLAGQEFKGLGDKLGRDGPPPPPPAMSWLLL